MRVTGWHTYNLGGFALARRTDQSIRIAVPLGRAGMAKDDLAIAGGVQGRAEGFLVDILVAIVVWVVSAVVMGLHRVLLDALPCSEGSYNPSDESDGSERA